MSTDLDGDERNARSHILECQVEAPLRQRADLPDLGVQPKDAIAEIRLREALVRRDGVHLQRPTWSSELSRAVQRRLQMAAASQSTNLGVVGGSEAGGGGQRLVPLQVEEVEGFLAGARHPGNGVAVSQGEAQLHVDLRPNTKSEGPRRPWTWRQGTSLEWFLL